VSSHQFYAPLVRYTSLPELDITISAGILLLEFTYLFRSIRLRTLGRYILVFSINGVLVTIAE